MSLGYVAIVVLIGLILELLGDPTPKSPVLSRHRLGVGGKNDLG